MSLYSLGADAARRKTAPASPTTIKRTGLVAESDGGGAGGGTAESAPALGSDNPLQALVLFIPAETVAIFVTVATALLGAFKGHEVTAAWVWYAFCAVLTPVFAWIGFATQWRKDHGGVYPMWANTPWFRIGASLFAFAAWGLAVAPLVGTAILCPSVTKANAVTDTAAKLVTCNAEALSGILVIIVGAILTVLDGLIDYTPKKT